MPCSAPVCGVASLGSSMHSECTHSGNLGQQVERRLVEDCAVAQDDVVSRERLEVARRVRRQRERLLQYSHQP